MRNTELNEVEWKRKKFNSVNCCPWGYASKLPKNEFPWLVKAATMTCDNPNSLDKYH